MRGWAERGSERVVLREGVRGWWLREGVRGWWLREE
jgi:hypothetical protein